MTFEGVVETVTGLGTRLANVFIGPTERLNVLYLATALLLALGVYYQRRRAAGEALSLRDLAAWLTPKDVLFHPSAKTDYLFFAVNRLMYPILVLPFVFGAGTALAVVQGGLESLLPQFSFHLPPGLALDLAFSLVTVLAMDFGLFVAHYLVHKVPFLWEFHKVHHSTEVLTPISVYRMHPVDDAISMSTSGLCMGIAQGVWFAVFPTTGSMVVVFQLNLVLFLFYVVGYNLRHSHVWIDFGWLSRVFVSPAMHQIHHSLEERHWDTNMGFLFSFWDHWAGTRVLPQGREELRFGLDGKEEPDYHGVLRLYLVPLLKIRARWKEMLAMERPTRLLLLVTLAIGVGISFASLRTRPRTHSSVQLADLTWTEVRDRVAQGTTTVIIPTGGTEQNGPHVILGKHNYIVLYAAEAIARRQGKTLVAPVMAYVPEGEIEPPSGHMTKAGTLSMSESTFEAVLEQTARSLATHGFRLICFLGDSGGNQGAQERVAKRLNTEWAQKGVRVLHLGDYYASNGQVKHLQAEGESAASIGGHAGIRDTSELLYVHPRGVRLDERKPMGGSDFATSGVDGDPTRATTQRGAAMLELKIRAALKQLAREGAAAPDAAPPTSATKGAPQG